MGESGCGKSTTGRAWLKLVDSQRGTLTFDGRQINPLHGSALQHLRRDIQIIFQDPYAALDPRLTVGFSIMEPLLVHNVMRGKEAQRRLAWLLERVGLLPEHERRYPLEFSGGQRQRICIARALALNPKVVIADEAVSALDVSIQAQIINLLPDLQREFGIAFLFISHDMAVPVAAPLVQVGPGHFVACHPIAGAFKTSGEKSDMKHTIKRNALVAAVLLASNPKLDVMTAPSIQQSYISLNVTQKPFDNLKVPQALNYTINKTALIKVAFSGYAVPAEGEVPPTIDFAARYQPWPYDPAKARELLKEAGYPNGFTSTLWSSHNHSTAQKVLQFVQQQLAQVGVKVTVTAMDAGQRAAQVESVGAKDTGVRMFYTGWSASIGEADWALSPLFASQAAPLK